MIAEDARERLTDRLFALTSCVGVSGVDHLDAGFHSGSDQGNVLRSVRKPVGPQADADKFGLSQLQRSRRF
jgi:hypothetical protein